MIMHVYNSNLISLMFSIVFVVFWFHIIISSIVEQDQGAVFAPGSTFLTGKFLRFTFFEARNV